MPRAIKIIIATTFREETLSCQLIADSLYDVVSPLHQLATTKVERYFLGIGKGKMNFCHRVATSYSLEVLHESVFGYVWRNSSSTQGVITCRHGAPIQAKGLSGLELPQPKPCKDDKNGACGVEPCKSNGKPIFANQAIVVADKVTDITKW